MRALFALMQTAVLGGLAAAVAAQEPAKAGAEGAAAVPNPVTEHHRALATFAGRWNSVTRMNAMPGVPGMETATEFRGSERTELVCNGLYLRSLVNGSMGGQPFQGLWLVGYDPFAKTYRTLWVDGTEPGAGAGTGAHDAATGAWTFQGGVAQGTYRSEITFAAADRVEETCYMTRPGAAEAEWMTMVRERVAGDAAAVDAAAPKVAAATDHHRRLHRLVGDWNATVRMQMAPGAPWTEQSGTERVTAVCGGKWLWTDFRSEMMGMPLEGHALLGYDTAKDEYVGYWIDSWSPVPLASRGQFDAEANALRMQGKGVDMMGRAYTAADQTTWRDDDTRVFKSRFEGPDGATSMEIVYTRAN